MSVITAKTSLLPRLREVLSAYRRARHEMEMFLGVDSACAVVAGVHRGAWPRRGHLPNGMEYFVRGMGYTVVLPTGGQVHLDGTDDGDSLTLSDLTMFFRTAENAEPPGHDELKQALREITREGGLQKSGRGRYVLL